MMMNTKKEYTKETKDLILQVENFEVLHNLVKGLNALELKRAYFIHIFGFDVELDHEFFTSFAKNVDFEAVIEHLNIK